MSAKTTTPPKPARLANADDLAKIDADLRVAVTAISRQQGKINGRITQLDGTLWTIQQTQQQLSKDVQRLITILKTAADSAIKR